MKEKRNIGYDYIRILACYMVIVNHTISNVIGELANGFSAHAFIGDFIFNACRMNVVSFILLSGALLLNKEDSVGKWLSRIFRIVVVIIVFSALYYDWKNGNLLDYFRTIISTNVTNAYWYLYLYLGIIILLPFLQKLTKVMSKKDYLYLLGIFLVTNSIYPLLVHYLNFPNFQFMFSSIFSYWGGWIIVYLLGYYLLNKMDNINFSVTKIIVLVLVWFIGNLIPTIITYREIYYKHDNSLFMDNPFWIWSLLATLSLDCMLILIGKKYGNNLKVNRVISRIAGLTFGVYLLSDKLISIVSPYFAWLNINVVLKTLIIDIVIFIVGAIITAVLKLIPKVNKLL